MNIITTIAIGLYAIYAIHLVVKLIKKIQQIRLLKKIKLEWFPKGKYVFFLYSNSQKWEHYFKTNLIPKIKDQAVIWNWSTRRADGWRNDSIEAKILKSYRTKYFYPLGVVFLPNGKVKVFSFYAPYLKMIKSGKDDYYELEREFLTLVKQINHNKTIG